MMKKLLSLLLAVIMVLSLAFSAISFTAYAESTKHQQPSSADLNEIESNIVYPNATDYLSSYKQAYIKSSKGSTETKAYSNCDSEKSVMSMADGSRVVVLAEHGKYSCVIDTLQKAAGWVLTENLDSNYYGLENPLCTDLRSALESWTDIDQIYSANGCIIGIKTNGSTVSLRYEENGIDISNWGGTETYYRSHCQPL